jgi:putative transposase
VLCFHITNEEECLIITHRLSNVFGICVTPKTLDIKAKIHRPIEGVIKTVSKCPSGRYFASILTEVVVAYPETSVEGSVIGIDLGLKHFAVVSDGNKVSKFDNPKHIAKHAQNLKRKQQKLARKKDGSRSRFKNKKLVAKVHERVSARE